MSRELSPQTSVTFHDVAVYFSEEDWGHLEEWQKELYKNVMKEIHAALLSMGYRIVNPSTLFRIRRGKEVNVCDQPGPADKRDLHNAVTGFAKTNPDMLFRITPDEDPHCRNRQLSGKGQTVNSPAASVSTGQSDVIIVIDPDGEPYCIDPPEGAEGGTAGRVAPGDDLVMVAAEDTYPVKLSGRPKPLRTTRVKHPPDHFQARDGEKTSARQKRTYQPASETACDREARNLGFPLVQPLDQAGGRLLQCRLCEKCFATTSNLNRHQRNHSGAKAYICGTCGKSFRDLHQLKVHHRTHTGEKPYQCTECLKRFTNLHHLKGHWRVHTGERPYRCTQCERSFSQRHSLVTHLKSHGREQT